MCMVIKQWNPGNYSQKAVSLEVITICIVLKLRDFTKLFGNKCTFTCIYYATRLNEFPDSAIIGMILTTGLAIELLEYNLNKRMEGKVRKVM